MQVQVLYFGVLKDILRRDRERVELPGPVPVAALLLRIRESQPGHDTVWDSLAIAVNEVYAQRDHVLRDGDELALLPPVSGGYGGQA